MATDKKIKKKDKKKVVKKDVKVKKKTEKRSKVGESSNAAALGNRKNDIDDIFSQVIPAAQRKAEQLEIERKKEAKIAKLKKQKKEANKEAKPVRYDAQLGLPIYSEESLNMLKGGNTPLCPFDCNCCF